MKNNLLTKVSLFSLFFLANSYFIFYFDIKPSNALVDCEGRAFTESGRESDLFLANGLSITDCREKINDFVARWCLSRQGYCTLKESSFKSKQVILEEKASNGTCATLYDNGDLTGRSYAFHVNHKPRYLGRDFNDRASSARVQPGYQLILFEHRDHAGEKVILKGTNSRTEFRNLGFWNRASSGICERVVAPPPPPPKCNSLNLVLDANNGKGDIYLYPKSDTKNLNHLWKIVGVTDGYHMIISKKTGGALDAGGGSGTLYLHDKPDKNNPNHLWKLTQLPGDYWIITSRVNGYALDANTGNGNLYLHPNPDKANPNHLWKFLYINDYIIIGSRLEN